MDNRYTQAKIYKIISDSTDKIYIGSTTEKSLARRLAGHRYDYGRWKANTRSYISSFELLEKDDYKIILIENFPCSNKDELRAREQWHIEQNALCINKQKAYSGCANQKEYRAMYREEHKEELAQYRAQYNALNKEKVTNSKAAYRVKNAELIRQKNAEYRAKNIDKIKEQHDCVCGGRYKKNDKAKHERTKKHQAYLQQ